MRLFFYVILMLEILYPKDKIARVNLNILFIYIGKGFYQVFH